MQPREAALLRLRTESEPWDVVIIGGGASGLGCALDAALRGLRVVLIDKGDFASGTSSTSTKLIHGGVRYLEKAVKELDPGQYHLVREALRERGTMLRLAPQLSHPLTTLLPLHNAWERFYFGIGLWLYNLLAGKARLARSRFFPKKKLPGWMNPSGLFGALSYQDGQFDDGAYAVALARTADAAGALVLNYVSAEGFEKDEAGRITKVKANDTLTGEALSLPTRSVLNATGPAADALRQMARPNAMPRLRPSQGVHIVTKLPPGGMDLGVLDPRTADGRVLFLLPWHGYMLIGTTDTPVADAHTRPQATLADVRYILKEANEWLTEPIQPEDIRSVWAGYRPLVAAAGKAGATEALIRNHEVEVFDEEGLVSLLGGKWTTYRQMAKDAVDALYPLLGKAKVACNTATHPLVGAGEVQDPMDGTIREAYIRWCVKQAGAQRVSDVLRRRLPLAALDLQAARDAAPTVARILAAELGQEETWQAQEVQRFLDETAPEWALLQQLRQADNPESA